MQFDAKSVVKEDMPAYNVWGTIPGKSDDMILLSGHYDSYFDGFQDDNCAIALMFGIARTLLEVGYQPEKTIVFCCMAAEEWELKTPSTTGRRGHGSRSLRSGRNGRER